LTQDIASGRTIVKPKDRAAGLQRLNSKAKVKVRITQRFVDRRACLLS
jgi:hypothetical protein